MQVSTVYVWSVNNSVFESDPKFGHPPTQSLIGAVAGSLITTVVYEDPALCMPSPASAISLVKMFLVNLHFEASPLCRALLHSGF